MLISFWSPYHGQSGTTSNAIATAVNMALNYELRVLLTHSQYFKSGMESAFYNDRDDIDIVNFKDIGIDSIQRLAKAKKLQSSDFKNYTKPIIQNRLDLLTGSTKPYKELFDSIDDDLLSILKYAKEAYDAVLIDVNSGKFNNLTEKILSDSDIVVININQNENIIKSILKDDKWDILDNKDKIMVLGRYDKNSKCTYSYVERTYKYKDKIYTVPYSCDFMDANNNHNVVKFFKANTSNISNKDNAFFMMEVNKIVERLMDIMEVKKENIKNPIKNVGFMEGVKSIFK